MERQQNEELLRVLSLLKTSEERYRIIAESVDEAICVIDLQMRFTFFNRRAEEITSYRRDELIGHSVLEIVGAEFRKQIADGLGRTIHGTVAPAYEIVLARKDGKRVPAEVRSRGVTLGNERVLLCILRDVSDRKAREEALRLKNKELSIISGIASIINRSERMEEILEGTLSGSLELLEMDAGAIYLANPVDKSKLVLRAFVPRTEPGFDVEPRKSVRADPSLNTEKVFTPADGGTPLFREIFVDRTALVIVPILLKGFAIGLMAFYSGALPAKYRELPDLLSIGSQLGIAIDNHTLLRTLRATSNYMAEIINESPDAIITADAQGNIISSNKRVARLLQYDMIELAGMNMKQLSPPDAAELVLAGDRSYVRDFLRKDGTTITLNISTSHFESGDVPGGYIIALKDLSEIVGLKIVPIAETAVEGAKRFHLEKGFLYLLDKTKDNDSMEIFADQVKHNIQGLCVTRQNPKKVREKYGLEKTPIVWLNGSDLPTGEHCIKPDNLTGLGATIYKFLSEANEGIVLLDGAEYLVARNSFDSVLKFLHLLNDRVMVSNSGVLLCLDPLSLETRQYHLLKTELRDFNEQ